MMNQADAPNLFFFKTRWSVMFGLLLSIFLLFQLLGLESYASASGIAKQNGFVTVQINLSSDRHWIGKVPVEEKGIDALAALKTFAAINSLPVETRETSYGPYVVSVAGVAEKQVTTASGWGFWINGQSPEAGADQSVLRAGDLVSWSLYDYDQTLFPIIKTVSSSGSTGPFQSGDQLTITVQAAKTSYDENWNATISIIPVRGATVEIAQDQHTIKLISDTNGQVNYVIQGEQPVRISAFQFEDRSGLPLLVRSKYQWFDVQFVGNYTDVPLSHWAYGSIERASKKGWFGPLQDRSFQPGSLVTRAETFRAIGQMLHQQPLNSWTAEAESTGLSNDVSGKMNQKHLTRAQLAVLIYRLMRLEPKLYGSFPIVHPTPAALKDQSLIQGYAFDAIATVRSRGLMNAGADGRFSPQRAVTRAELAHVLRFLDDAISK